MKNLFPYPLFVFFAMLAFNITAFTVVLQMDILVFHGTILKVIAWMLSAGSWVLVYIFRNK